MLSVANDFLHIRVELRAALELTCLLSMLAVLEVCLSTTVAEGKKRIQVLSSVLLALFCIG